MQLGLELVASEGSQLTLLHVFPSRVRGQKGSRDLEEDKKLIDDLRRQMDGFCHALGKNNGIKINPVIIGGGVELEVLNYIKKHKFDLVIMGVNSNGTDNHPGSHLTNIIEQANAPVLVIPNELQAEKVAV